MGWERGPPHPGHARRKGGMAGSQSRLLKNAGRYAFSCHHDAGIVVRRGALGNPKLREIWREGVSKGREHGLTAVGRGIEGCRLSVDALLVPFPGVSSLGEGVGRPSRRNPGRLRRGRAVARPSGAVRFRLLPRATSIRWAAPGRGTPRAAPGRASPTPSGRRSAGRSCG